MGVSQRAALSPRPGRALLAEAFEEADGVVRGAAREQLVPEWARQSSPSTGCGWPKSGSASKALRRGSTTQGRLRDGHVASVALDCRRTGSERAARPRSMSSARRAYQPAPHAGVSLSGEALRLALPATPEGVAEVLS